MITDLVFGCAQPTVVDRIAPAFGVLGCPETGGLLDVTVRKPQTGNSDNATLVV